MMRSTTLEKTKKNRLFFSFSSRIRGEVFRFERFNTLGYGLAECNYRLPAFAYKRFNKCHLQRQVGSHRKRPAFSF